MAYAATAIEEEGANDIERTHDDGDEENGHFQLEGGFYGALC